MFTPAFPFLTESFFKDAREQQQTQRPGLKRASWMTLPTKYGMAISSTGFQSRSLWTRAPSPLESGSQATRTGSWQDCSSTKRGKRSQVDAVIVSHTSTSIVKSPTSIDSASALLGTSCWKGFRLNAPTPHTPLERTPFSAR